MQYSVDPTVRDRKRYKKNNLSSTQKGKNVHVTFS